MPAMGPHRALLQPAGAVLRVRLRNRSTPQGLVN
jgi:hypothetical protein